MTKAFKVIETYSNDTGRVLSEVELYFSTREKAELKLAELDYSYENDPASIHCVEDTMILDRYSDIIEIEIS